MGNTDAPNHARLPGSSPTDSAPNITPRERAFRQMQMRAGRWAWVPITVEGGFCIGVAVENIRGYFPSDYDPVPTFDEAAEWADKLNGRRLESEDAARIVASSMHAEPLEGDAYSFDGFGINGPDQYRTRLCTFADVKRSQEIGERIAAALNAHAECEDAAPFSITLHFDALEDAAWLFGVASKTIATKKRPHERDGSIAMEALKNAKRVTPHGFTAEVAKAQRCGGRVRE